jgi:hypothetical protein
MPGKIMAEKDCTELAKVIARMSMNLASRKEIKTIEDITQSLRNEFDVTRDDVVDSIVEFHRQGPRKLSELSKKLAEIKGEARTDKRLRNKITELEEHLDKGTLPQPVKPKAVTPEIAALRDIRKDLRAKVNKSEPAVKQKLEKQIRDLNKIIETGDIQPRKPKIFEPLSKDVERLTFERDRLRQEINRRINNLKPRTIFERTIEPFNAARAIITSFDLSATLRQGGFVVIGHPVRGVKNIPDMLKAFASESKSSKIMADIIKRPNAPVYARSKLHLSSLEGDTPLSKMEEAYMSRWAEKIPLVRASERAYLTFLNKLRADSFDAMTRTLAKNGQPTEEEYKAIANFVNVATGRGNLGQAEQAAVALNTVFFAPKYVSSRFQLIAGQPFFRGTGRTKKLIAQEYARYLAGMGTIYALAETSGFTVEVDPRSPNFGKLRIGNTRLDPLSGLSQTTVVLSRIASGKTKSSITDKITPIRGGEVKFGRTTTFDVITRFLRSKLSPLLGTAIDVAGAKGFIGEPVTPITATKNLLVPLSMREIYEAMQEHGVAKGSAFGLLALFGVGLQIYGPKKKQQKEKKK